MKKKTCIIGAGPAGLMAAVFSAASGAEIIVIEANSSPGRKLLLTGGGRCNLAHRASPKELVREFGEKGRFLSYCLHEFSPRGVLEFFAGLGVQVKLEKDGCVFPVTNRAGDVRDALFNRAKSLGVKFLFGTRAGNIKKEDEMFTVVAEQKRICAESVIITTGGLSYPKTGCTGDGYQFARRFGHRIVETRAALVPLVTYEKWPALLAGTALPDVRITTRIDNRKIAAEGALVFTDNGFGGPAAQNMSRYLTDYLPAVDSPIEIVLDTLPRLEQAELEDRIIEYIEANPKRKMSNIIAEFVPKRLSVVLCEQAVYDGDMQGGILKKDMRKKLIKLVKAMPLSIVRVGPIAEAVITRGGVDVTEINPKRMESKICRGLFFAGEVIDVDGPCGGYNLQVCWSTGALAGSSAAKE